MTSPGVDDLRGTIILCDSVHPTTDGKWIIVGTYTTWWSKKPAIAMQTGIGCYVRFQVQRVMKDVPWKIVLFDSATTPNGEKIIEVNGVTTITDPNTPVEAGLVLPEFVVKSPVPNDEIPLGQRAVLRYRIWLDLDGKPIASSPLNIFFLNPAETIPYVALHDMPRKPGSSGA